MAEEFKMCNRRCIYRGEKNLNGCDYMYFTGKRRGCQPGEDCTKFEKGNRMCRRVDLSVTDRAPESEKDTDRYTSDQRRKLRGTDCIRAVKSEYVIR